MSIEQAIDIDPKYADAYAALAITLNYDDLLELWQRPWVIKSVAKAVLAFALPAAAMQRLAVLWPPQRSPTP